MKILENWGLLSKLCMENQPMKHVYTGIIHSDLQDISITLFTRNIKSLYLNPKGLELAIAAILGKSQRQLQMI